MFNTSGYSLSDIAAVSGKEDEGFGGNGAWWIIILFLFVFMGGWGNGGFGGRCADRGAGVVDGYVLTSDFANVERKIDSVNNGLCDGFYAMNTGMLNGFANLQNGMAQGFAGINTALMTQSYETRLGTQALGAQMAECCCATQGAIKDVGTQGILNTNAIEQQIANCFCTVEKMDMQTKFDNAQNHCATMQAIDRIGDRIIDYLAADKTQALRDENQALRLAASQAAQNNYLIGQLRPAPIPAYQVVNPYCCNGGYNYYGNGGCNA